MRAVGTSNSTADDDEFPQYGIKVSQSAKAIRSALPVSAQKVLSEVLDMIASNPDANSHRTRRITSKRGVFIYTHPKPRIEVTYEIDRKSRLIRFFHFASPLLTSSKLVFISYSHRDGVWLAKLRLVLTGFEADGRTSIWSDEHIQPGTEWRQGIQRALSEAGVAILLVSPNFLTSKFISEHELPVLLRSASERDLRIFWIAVSLSAYAQTGIEKYQAVNDPRFPLDTLEPEAQDRALKKIYELVRDEIDA